MQQVTARIELPTRTILKVLLVLATLWFLARIGPVLQQLFAGIVLALALYPPVARLQRRGMSKGRAIASVFGAVVAVLVVLLWFLVPEMVDEGQTFVEDADEYLADGTTWLQDNVPWVYDRLRDLVETAEEEQVAPEDGEVETGAGGDLNTGSTSLAEGAEDENPVDAEDAISVGQQVAGFLSTTFVAIVLAIYFLVDGDRAFRWLARDLNPDLVRRLRRALPALSEIVSSYVAHQIQTSVLCGVFTYTVLSLLDVPSALTLATIAAFADAVPLVGVVLATIPAGIVALTQGWEVAVAVLVALVAYQAFENWVLIPRFFGRSLNLSSFAMLMAVLIGWELAGLVGVLLALPTAAALLVLERVWMDQDPGIALPDALRPGPGDLADAALDAAVDLAGDEAGAADPGGNETVTEPAAEPAPPAPAPDTRPDGRQRRGRRGGVAEQPTPGPASG